MLKNVHYFPTFIRYLWAVLGKGWSLTRVPDVCPSWPLDLGEGLLGTRAQLLRSGPSNRCILGEYGHPSSIVEKLFYNMHSTVL